MSIHSIGLRAYTNALDNFKKAEMESTAKLPSQKDENKTEFKEVLKSSLNKVNDLRLDRSDKILSFASGESQNVHELMIAMQKASLAMSMTTAVRNKALEAYKELTKIQF